MFGARFHNVRPQAIVRYATPQDVAETISLPCGTGWSARPERRSLLRRALGDEPWALIIDVTPMGSVSVSGDVAVVGAGAPRRGVRVAQQQGLAIPAGTCPPVGVAGLTLGGGLGILGCGYGVTSDRLLAARIVLADGRALDCDQHHHQDLFWALRGAGAGSFGVVTSLMFGAVPAPQVTTAHLTWPPARAATSSSLARMGPPATDELAASLKLSVGGKLDQPASVDVYGAPAAPRPMPASCWTGWSCGPARTRPWRGSSKRCRCGHAAVLGRPTGGGSRGRAWPPLPIGAVPVSGCQVGVLQAAAPLRGRGRAGEELRAGSGCKRVP